MDLNLFNQVIPVTPQACVASTCSLFDVPTVSYSSTIQPVPIKNVRVMLILTYNFGPFLATDLLCFTYSPGLLTGLLSIDLRPANKSHDLDG